MEYFKSNNSIISAIQITKEKIRDGELLAFATEKNKVLQHTHYINVLTRDGMIRAELGDWIIKTMGDEVTILKNGSFKLLYNRI